MKRKKQVWKILRSVVMFGGIIALLGLYLLTVSNLPSRIYTESQQEFLAYNRARSIQQIAPTLNWEVANDKAMVTEGEAVGNEDIRQLLLLPWQSSRVKATLKARYEEKGGISVAVYDLIFEGVYGLKHTAEVSATIDMFFPFPSNLETLHDVAFLVDGEEPEDAVYSIDGVSWRVYMEPGDSFDVTISYSAAGANSFAYSLMHNQRTDIDITVDVIGLEGSEIAKGTLPASIETDTENGEHWVWHYDGLIADRDIRLNLPEKLNYAQRVAAKQSDYRMLGAAAPWLVGLFIISLGMVLRLDNIRLRLESYLLMGFGMALFFPLLTFFSGALPQTVAAVLAFIIVAGLLLVFVKRAVGGKNIVLQTGILLVVFLGLFALGIVSSWRGIMLTSGGVILVGLFMLLYARKAILPESPTPAPIEEAITEEAEIESDAEMDDEKESELVKQVVVLPTPVPEPMVEVDSELTHSHCPYCARALEEDYAFCPGCGRDTSEVIRCESCGYVQVIPVDAEIRYCVKCGEGLMER